MSEEEVVQEAELFFEGQENATFEHSLRCMCGGCMVPIPDSMVESLADHEPGTKFEYDCPEHGKVEHILTKTEKERMHAAKKYAGPTDFVHLHNHTIYSALDGVAKPEEYFQGCAECDLPAFAITDHGSIAGVPDAYWAAAKNKVKYISGCEIYFNDFEPEFKEWQVQAKANKGIDVPRKFLNGHSKLSTIRAEVPNMHAAFQRNRHLTVLCKNMEGYKNLIRINNIANEKGFYYKPRVWYDLLRDNKEGLIVLSGCLNGPVCHSLRSEHASAPVSRAISHRFKGTSMNEHGYADPKNIALQWVMQFQEDFGDDFYLELQMPGEEIPLGKDAFRMVSNIGRKLGIKSLLTNDCHYLSRDDFNIQMVMMATAQDKKIGDPTMFHVNSDEQFFKTRAQMRQTFIEHKYTAYATQNEFEMFCDNTLDVASKCDMFAPDLDPKLPEVEDANRELARRCLEAMKKKGLNEKPEYVHRLRVELQRIIEKEFSSYFLITADIVNESKDRGWPVGPARGSAGGSLLCYLLDIIELDPILFDLSFDRFLSASRGGYMLNATME